MSYTTQKNLEGQWEVRFAGKIAFTVPSEEVADDLAIALAASRHERLKREKAIGHG